MRKNIYTINEITDQFRNFKATDNYPVNNSMRDKIILKEKARLLTLSICATNLFPNFMRKNSFDQKNVLTFFLKKPIVIENIEFTSLEVKYGSNAGFSNNHFFPNKHIRTCLKSNLEFTNQKHLWDYKSNKLVYPNQYKRILKKAEEELAKRNFADLLLEYSPYNTPEEVLGFLHIPALPYGKLKLPSSALSIDRFYDYYSHDFSKLENLKEEYPSVSEIDAKQILVFKNKYDEVVQKSFKMYDKKSQTKLLFLSTSWREKGIIPNKEFYIPLPEQLLYNLPLINKSSTKVIIFTDSPEIASLNQENSPEGIVWVSAITDDNSIVDWSPLEREDVTVYYLITNHSGKNLAQTYVDSYDLLSYLNDNFDINLKYVQLEVKYPANSQAYFEKASDILANRTTAPEAVEESIIAMESFEEFKKYYKKALAYCNQVPFYKENPVPIQFSDTDKPESLVPSYLVRPALTRGEVSMLHAPPKHGKTSFSLSFCAAIVARKKIFADKWWTVPANGYDMNKVLYLDFETGEVRYNRAKKKFVYPYFDNNKRQECEANFIFKDLKADNIDYSDPANHQAILDMVEDAKQEGTQGQPVDLVVIDTYSKFLGTESIKSWDKIEPLLNEIISQNIAVLIVHHSNSEGEVQGYRNKIKGLVSEIIIQMDECDIQHRNLKDFRNIGLYRTRDSHITVDNEPFKIRFENDKWEAFSSEPESEEVLKQDPTKSKYKKPNTKEEFKAITEAYKKDEGLKHSDIQKLMNLKKSQYSEYRKEK